MCPSALSCPRCSASLCPCQLSSCFCFPGKLAQVKRWHKRGRGQVKGRGGGFRPPAGLVPKAGRSQPASLQNKRRGTTSAHKEKMKRGQATPAREDTPACQVRGEGRNPPPGPACLPEVPRLSWAGSGGRERGNTEGGRGRSKRRRGDFRESLRWAVHFLREGRSRGWAVAFVYLAWGTRILENQTQPQQVPEKFPQPKEPQEVSQT